MLRHRLIHPTINAPSLPAPAITAKILIADGNYPGLDQAATPTPSSSA